MSFRPSNDEY
jgi:hypothetical protein